MILSRERVLQISLQVGANVTEEEVAQEIKEQILRKGTINRGGALTTKLIATINMTGYENKKNLTIDFRYAH